MDRLVYVAMSGAKETLRAQAANNHNLANASTVGFRADLSAFQTQQVTGRRACPRAPTPPTSQRRLGCELRHARQPPAATSTWRCRGRAGSRCRPATAPRPIRAPAICAWIPNGTADHRRRQSGARAIPVRSRCRRTPRSRSAATARSRSFRAARRRRPSRPCGRIKLVNPPSDSARARRRTACSAAPAAADADADASVQLVPGTLESSNVNIAETMTNMIELARSYDMQVKAMKTAEDNDASSAPSCCRPAADRATEGTEP